MKRTPLKAIRAKCLDCAGTSRAVEGCDFETCGLYPYRSGHRSKEATITPIKAIRKECLDCCRGSAYEVSLCPVEDCALYVYRFGKNPARAGVINSGSFKKDAVEPSVYHTTPQGEGSYTLLPMESKFPGRTTSKPAESRKEVGPL